jgi:hypothetical protein
MNSSNYKKMTKNLIFKKNPLKSLKLEKNILQKLILKRIHAGSETGSRSEIMLKVGSRIRKTHFQNHFTQGIAKRCRLSWLTNSALVYEPKNAWGGGGELQGLSQ